MGWISGRSTKVTFVLPFMRHTTGGVYTIDQFSRGLGRRVRVQLVSKTPVGLATRASTRRTGRRLSVVSDGLPAADVLIVPADDPDGAELLSLPTRAGKPVLFLQGFGRPPGAPAVLENLGMADRVIAVSRWCAEEARSRGCEVELVAPGVDRKTFFPGRPVEERPPVVALMTHSKDWKGTSDAIVAFEAVAADWPDVRFVYFGISAPEAFTKPVIVRPTRKVVGEIMRASAAFVCPSWEEGLGLPGIEALACGTSLATTDTRGSRDYAFDRETALVSPPHDPAALASHVVRLLEDAELRGRLARAGRNHVAAAFPSWPAAADTFASALDRLL